MLLPYSRDDYFGQTGLFAQIVEIISGIVSVFDGVIQCKEIGIAFLGVVDAEAGCGELIIRARNSLLHRADVLGFVIVVLAELDDLHVLVEYLNIQTQRLKLLNEYLEGLRNARLRYVVTLDDRLVGLDTAGNIVRLDGQDLLQRVARAVVKSANRIVPM